MRNFILAALFTILACGTVRGQGYVAPPVSVSDEIINVKGEKFRVHKVKPKQTLFSLSRAYNVTVEQIRKANPQVGDALKEGTTIFIPDNIQEVKAEEPETAPVAAVYQTEPPVRKGKSAVSARKEATQGKYRTHRVKWFEAVIMSAQDIAAKYEVSLKDLMKLNGLTSEELSIGQILYIPNPGETVTGRYIPPADPAAQQQAADSDSTQTVNPKTAEEGCETPFTRHARFSASHPAKVSLLLPFDIKEGTGSTNYMDFYCGFLLAMNNLKGQDIHVDLSVYDISRKGADEILRNTQLLDEDLIIGPVNSDELSQMAGFCNFNRIPFVSPMDQKADALVDNSPYLFQFPTRPSAQRHNLVESMGADDRSSVLLIYESENPDMAPEFKSILEGGGIRYSEFSYRILDGRDIGTQMTAKLSPDKVNKVVVASENEAFVLDVLRNLNILKSYPIEVYGLPKWRNFDKVDMDYYHNLNLHISLPYFVDYSDSYTKTFVKQYRALYNAEPSQFAFQGHDIALYFLTALAKYGSDFITMAPQHTMSLLQSEVSFVRSDEGGYRNTATRSIIYNSDYQIDVVRSSSQRFSSRVR